LARQTLSTPPRGPLTSPRRKLTRSTGRSNFPTLASILRSMYARSARDSSTPAVLICAVMMKI
jgi:hypothetical protein